MSNSPLVTYTKLSPNCNKPRNHKIDTITIHCFVGQVTAQSGCNSSRFVNYDPNGGASCNYVVGHDGSIGLCVEEANRSWCTSSSSNDHRAITIEVASETVHPYKVTTQAYEALIRLVADICKRNDIKELKWRGDKNLIGQVSQQNMTVHRWFAAKACPGEYLYNLHGDIAARVNNLLNNGNDYIITTQPVTITYQAYDTKWLNNITDHNPNNIQGYAGNFGKPISGIYVDASVGNVYYRAHQKGGSWLPEVKNREDYAGNLGKPIDGFIVRSDSTKLYYQAHDATHGWLGVISGYDINNSSEGYAGWLGYAIDAIMIWADPIITYHEVPKEETPVVETPKPIYRIRLSWEDNKSQIGAYTNLESAKKVCPEGYAVYDPEGNEVFRKAISEVIPEAPKPEEPVEIPTQDPVVEPEVAVPEIEKPSVEEPGPSVDAPVEEPKAEEPVIEEPVTEPEIELKTEPEESETTFIQLVAKLLNSFCKWVTKLFTKE